MSVDPAAYEKYRKKKIEALPAEALQEDLRVAIDTVIDTEVFNAELDAEMEDSQLLAGVRRVAVEAIQGMDIVDLRDDQ